LELYTKGDTAPGGRFMYRFVAGKLPKAMKKGCGSAVEGAAATLPILGAAAGAIVLAASSKCKGRSSKKRREND
ncbi:MAG: hypothetical protein IKY07_06100, partial [Clostridia bacterium]|nr:hypothetical protein [Clostridia bacterium]